MKIRLSKWLKNNEIAFSNATERDEISRHYYARLFKGANEGSIWPDFRLC